MMKKMKETAGSPSFEYLRRVPVEEEEIQIENLLYFFQKKKRVPFSINVYTIDL